MVRTRSNIPNMKHMNDNCLGAISIKTSGLDPRVHDLLQVAIIISDDYFTPFSIAPFYMKLKPRFPECAVMNKRIVDDSRQHGYDYHNSADAMDLWFTSLGLFNQKQVQLLGIDVAWQISFLREWLGETATNMYFSPHIRDLGSVARFVNDRACMRNSEYPVNKYRLNDMSGALGVVNEMKKDSLQDAITTLEVYRRLIGVQV